MRAEVRSGLESSLHQGRPVRMQISLKAARVAFTNLLGGRKLANHG